MSMAFREKLPPAAVVPEARIGAFEVPDYHLAVTTREEAHIVLDRLPDDRVEAALAALEAVEGKDATIEGILYQESCNAETPR
jgi:hypothetical protein